MKNSISIFCGAVIPQWRSSVAGTFPHFAVIGSGGLDRHRRLQSFDAADSKTSLTAAACWPNPCVDKSESNLTQTTLEVSNEEGTRIDGCLRHGSAGGFAPG